jgi:catechol 2,3-dioxygenase-like lactoylglutathione lyase family enzyme
MPVAFERVAPIFPVRDVARALERYRRLGFHGEAYVEAGFSSKESPRYGFLRWGPAEIHLAIFEELDPTTSASACYLYVDDADALFAAWTAAGVDGRFHAPADRAYGLREFAYVDPDGNLLRIGSQLKAGSC